MSYSIHSTLRDLLSNDAAKAVLEKHMPGATSHPDLQMAMSLTLMQVSHYPEAAQAGLNAEKLLAIEAELKSLG